MSLRESKAIACASSPGSAPPRQHARVLLPGHHVRVGDDDARPRRPSPSPRRRRRTRCRGSSRRCPAPAATSGSRAIAARGAGTFACGPSMCGNGSSARSVFSSGPVGGSTALSRCRIAEPLHVAADVGAGAQTHGPEHPGDQQPEAGGEQRPQHAVDRGEGGRLQLGAQPRTDPLEAGRQHAARDDRAGEGECRRPGGVAVAPARAARAACRAKRPRRSRPARGLRR